MSKKIWGFLLVSLLVSFYFFLDKNENIVSKVSIAKKLMHNSEIVLKKQTKVLVEQNISVVKNELKRIRFCLKSKNTHNGNKYFYNEKGQEYMVLIDENADGICDVNITREYDEKDLKVQEIFRNYENGEVVFEKFYDFEYDSYDRLVNGVERSDGFMEETVLEYNEEGDISFVSKVLDGELVKTYENFYLYDEENHILEHTPTVKTFDSTYFNNLSIDILEKKFYTYNEKGEMMHKIVYNKNAKDIKYYLDFKYNEKGQLLSNKKYYDKERPNENFIEYLYDYNEAGLRTTVRRRERTPYIDEVSEELSSEYKYDEYGKMIEKISNGIVILEQEFQICAE